MRVEFFNIFIIVSDEKFDYTNIIQGLFKTVRIFALKLLLF